MAQARVGLDLLGVHLPAHPLLETFHDGLAVSLVVGQPLLRAHCLLAGLRVYLINFAETFEHVPALFGELWRHRDEVTPGVAEAMSQNGLKVQAHVPRQGIAHLDGWLQVRRPAAQQPAQALSGMLPAGKIQRHRVRVDIGQKVGGKGAFAFGIHPGGGGTARTAQIQNAHGGVVLMD